MELNILQFFFQMLNVIRFKFGDLFTHGFRGFRHGKFRHTYRWSRFFCHSTFGHTVCFRHVGNFVTCIGGHVIFGHSTFGHTVCFRHVGNCNIVITCFRKVII